MAKPKPPANRPRPRELTVAEARELPGFRAVGSGGTWPRREAADPPDAPNRTTRAPTAAFDRQRALVHLQILIAAFGEVEAYDPRRSNERPPALWVEDKAYLSDLRSLLAELRRLNSLLEKLASNEAAPSPQAAREIGLVGVAGKKFVESYVDVLGKGTAMLTVGAIGALLYSLGVDREFVNGVLGLALGKGPPMPGL